MTRFAIASVALAAAVLSAGAASAAEWRVHIGDLDLSTPRGAAVLDRRITGASQGACVAGGPLDQARCRVLFRREAMERLPQSLRDDYARARSSRVVVRAPEVQN
ncbi:UrcA family protein [Brevundimonas staleyi]|uniref:UrcA family protein n=1 Tax=Brevundimonas staleyi TaxID=74326 RepID=A0ABW0FRS8_9CAUL